MNSTKRQRSDSWHVLDYQGNVGDQGVSGSLRRRKRFELGSEDQVSTFGGTQVVLGLMEKVQGHPIVVDSGHPAVVDSGHVCTGGHVDPLIHPTVVHPTVVDPAAVNAVPLNRLANSPGVITALDLVDFVCPVSRSEQAYFLNNIRSTRNKVIEFYQTVSQVDSGGGGGDVGGSDGGGTKATGLPFNSFVYSVIDGYLVGSISSAERLFGDLPDIEYSYEVPGNLEFKVNLRSGSGEVSWELFDGAIRYTDGMFLEVVKSCQLSFNQQNQSRKNDQRAELPFNQFALRIVDGYMIVSISSQSRLFPNLQNTGYLASPPHACHRRNRLEALYRMYESFIKLQSPPQLAYMLINTSYKILRVFLEGSGEEWVPKVLPARFYFIYGESLLAIRKVVGWEEGQEFIMASIERLSTGLRMYPDSCLLLFARSRACIVGVKERLRNRLRDTLREYQQEVDPVLKMAMEDFERGEGILFSFGGEGIQYGKKELESIEMMVELGEYIAKHWMLGFSAGEPKQDEESRPELREYGDRFREWSKGRYLALLRYCEEVEEEEEKEEEDEWLQGKAHLALGRYYLDKAQGLMEKYETRTNSSMSIQEDEEDKDEGESKRSLAAGQAQSILVIALKHLLNCKEEEVVLSLISDAQLSLANIMSETKCEISKTDQQDILYLEAGLRMKRLVFLQNGGSGGGGEGGGGKVVKWA